MAWASPPVFVSGNVLTAAQLNILSDDLRETAAGKATTAGGIFVTTAANTLAERVPGRADVLASETTTSTSYTDLATVGPAVTATLSASALIAITAQFSNNTAGAVSEISFTISGATTLGTSDDRALFYESSNANDQVCCSWVMHVGGLTSGSNTFTLKYKVNVASTGTFNRRRLSVIPF